MNGLFQMRDDAMWAGITPEELYAAVTALDLNQLTAAARHVFPTSHLPDRLVRDGRGQVVARLRPDPYERPR